MSAPIPRRPPVAECPLSFAQQRLWFLEQLEPGRPTYNSPLAFRLQGPLAREALARALNTIVTRHEVLRTTFTTRDGIPVQLVRDPSVVELRELDLSNIVLDERLAALHQGLHDEACRLFDLSRDVMLRAALFRLGPEDHVLLLTQHHIATDGWSMGILLREVAELYNAFSGGREPSLPALPIQYADFAVWQRDSLRGDVLEQEIAHWKAKLAGAPTLLAVPTDHPRPPVQGWHGASEPVTVSAPLTAGLRALGRRHGATLFITLLAALKALLYRYTQQDDLVVGAPVACRTRVETESLVGFFANTLALRTSLVGDPTFGELLGRVRRTCFDAYAHQELPFERLVEELQPERNRSHAPVVQTVLAFHNTPESGATFADLTLTPVPVEPGTAKFDLCLILTEASGELTGELRYDTALFEASTIVRLRQHFLTLLDGVVANAERRLSQLPLISDAEREQLLVSWNRTEGPYPRDVCVHDLFAAQVARTPDEIAVVFDEDSLTYRQLDARANQLARRLQREGVAAETTVALYFERSLDMIVAIVGVLKAGGAYVPLDTAAPAERLAFMIRDVGAAVLLTQEALAGRLPSCSARAISLDQDWARIADESTDAPAHGASADSAAYVMYTSGSTGTPKGVTVPHRAVLRLVMGTSYARFGADEVFFQLAPLAFDASTFEIWGALLHGARLVVAPPGLLSLAELGKTIEQAGVTTLWLTAGLFHQIVDEELIHLAGVRQLLAGGDVLSAAHVKRVLEAHPRCTVINGYGPTEGTTFTCCHAATDPATIGSSVPIGRPIANTRVYVLDAHGEPCPIGVPGELFIAGDGLAREYRNAPELTAQRFITRSVGARAAERLYRSGDLVRYRSDGTLEFLGRLDDQVKIRGYRVEPGEIEAALARHPSVRDVVVVARDDAGDRRLVAYVVPADGARVERDALQQHLRGTLPEYMVPAAFVALSALPLTASGKIDRRALPPASAEVANPREPLPASPDERMLREIWCHVLKCDDVVLDEDFFNLGGHSLLATQLLSRIEQRFDTRLTVADLFEAPTIRQQADLLRERRAGTSRRIVPIQPSGDKPPLFFIDAGPIHRTLGRRLGPEQPMLGVSHPPVEMLSHPFSLAEIAAHHVASIRGAQPTGPYYVAGWSAGGTVAYEAARQLRAAGAEVALLAMFEASPPDLHASTWRDSMARIGRRLRLHTGRVARLPLSDALPYVVARWRTVRRNTRSAVWRQAYKTAIGTGAGRERFQSIDDALLFAIRSYAPPPYPGRIVFFRSADRIIPGQPVDWGWGKLARDGVEIHVVPGDHISMFEEPNVATVVECLRPHLGASPRR